MKEQKFKIGNKPAILWGEKSEKVVLAVHGMGSYKRDVPIRIIADISQRYGYQVLSFDLPKHGERVYDNTIPFKIQNCVKELEEIYEYVKKKWKIISLFSCSIGSFFSLLAYKDKKIKSAFFLAPIFNIEDFYDKYMLIFGITDMMLEEEKEIEIPLGYTLDWDEYSYVKENPINRWNIPSWILCGEKDEVCSVEINNAFAKKFDCHLEVLKKSEHYFFEMYQLKKLRKTLEEYMKCMNQQQEKN